MDPAVEAGVGGDLLPLTAQRAATTIQRAFKGYIQRLQAAAIKSGELSQKADETNISRMEGWVNGQLAKATPPKLHTYGGDPTVKIARYRVELGAKAAVKLAATQQKRAAKVKGGKSIAPRAWLPVGVSPEWDEEHGVMLIATRAYAPGDVVLVEEVRTQTVGSLPMLTDQSPPSEQHLVWSAQLAAHNATDPLTQRRVRAMHKPALPPADPMAVALQTWAASEPTADSTPSPAAAVAAACEIPLVFLGNAVQDRTGP
jgi:hypothetical protein